MKKLVRKKNSNIAGVCAGISEYLNIDVILIRILFLILVFTSFPIIITYILMWILIPKETIG